MAIRDKVKKVNFKGLLKAFSILWMIAFIIIMTATNLGIDKTFNFLKWLGNSLILFGITVYGLLIGESLGIDRQKEYTVTDKDGKITGGLYQLNLKEYNDFRNQIDDIVIFFSQFVEWWIPQSLRTKQINFLSSNNVKLAKAKLIVDYCDYDDFWQLKKGAIKKIDPKTNQEIYIGKLTDRELDAVEMVLKGEITIHSENDSYYLEAFSEGGNKVEAETGWYINKQRRFNKNSNRAIRIVSGLVISLGLGILTVNELMNGGDTQAWVNLVSRVTTLFTSLLSGWLSGVVDVKLQARILKHKTIILHLFESSYRRHLFETYDENEKAKQEYEEEKKKEEEAINDVVDPSEMPLQIEEKPEDYNF